MVQVQDVRQWGGPAQRLPPGEDELLYGRAGYLYCLLFLHKHIGPMPDAAPVVGTPLHCLSYVRHEQEWKLVDLSCGNAAKAQKNFLDVTTSCASCASCP